MLMFGRGSAFPERASGGRPGGGEAGGGEIPAASIDHYGPGEVVQQSHVQGALRQIRSFCDCLNSIQRRCTAPNLAPGAAVTRRRVSAPLPVRGTATPGEIRGSSSAQGMKQQQQKNSVLPPFPGNYPFRFNKMITQIGFQFN